MEHVGRMGGGPFEPVSFDVEMDEGCGMGFSAVHKVRAQAVNSLVEALLARTRSARPRRRPCRPSSCARSVARPCAWRPAFPLPPTWRPSSPAPAPWSRTPSAPAPRLRPAPPASIATVDDLARGDWPEGVIPWLDEVCREADHARLDPWVRHGEPVAVGQHLRAGPCRRARRRGRGAPVHPRSQQERASGHGAAGAKAVWLSCELTLEEACELARAASVPVGLSVLGRERAMTSEHCVLQALGRCVHNCEKCPQRARRLSSRTSTATCCPSARTSTAAPAFGRRTRLTPRPRQTSWWRPASVGSLPTAPCLAPRRPRLRWSAVCRAIAAAKAGRRPAARLAGATSGHLFAGIG